MRISHGKIEFRATVGGGVPLILLHGRDGSKTEFRRLMTSSLAVGRTLLAIDLPGHGGSSVADDPDHTYTLEGYADAVIEVLEHLGIECAAVLGRSLGGHIGLQMAYSFPGFAGLLVEHDGSDLRPPVVEDRAATSGFGPPHRLPRPSTGGEVRPVSSASDTHPALAPPHVVARADDRYRRLPMIEGPPDTADLVAAGRAMGRGRPFMELVRACTAPASGPRTPAHSCAGGRKGWPTARNLHDRRRSAHGSMMRFLREVDRASSDAPILGLCLSG